jgi:hypothetical protein
MDNAYMVGRIASAKDMAQVITICSGAYQDRISGWLKFLDSGFQQTLFGLVISLDSVRVRVDERIEEYVADHSKTPETWGSKDGKRSRVDPVFSVATLLMSECHMSETEAWNTTYSRGVCYAMVHAERNGVDLVDAEEMEKARQKIRELEARNGED